MKLPGDVRIAQSQSVMEILGTDFGADSRNQVSRGLELTIRALEAIQQFWAGERLDQLLAWPWLLRDQSGGLEVQPLETSVQVVE